MIKKIDLAYRVKKIRIKELIKLKKLIQKVIQICLCPVVLIEINQRESREK